MKRMLLIFLLSFILVGCSSTLNTAGSSDTFTSVRVIDLSIQESISPMISKTNEHVSLRRLNQVNLERINYIYPGDSLTFTIELEDPNFEFISLLAITFNETIIRANVDNTIVSTRDCGANICVDFPFTVERDIFTYQVQEVTFAKVNAEAGVKAIIDESSNASMTIDIYQEEVFPYVRTSVETLNEMLDFVTFYESNATFTSDTWHQVFQDWNRILVIDNFNPSLPYASSIDVENAFTSSFGTTPQTVGILDNGVEKDDGLIEKTHVFFNLFSVAYEEVFFYHEGNTIYIDILGESYLLIEMGQNTLIRTPNQDDFYQE